MVYAYDQWLPMPTKDLFDTQMMLASVNAAKDMYEKGLEEMKEFNEKYGDFLSPIAADMQWNQEHVIDPVYNTINELYKAGIDPLRSAEGRSIIRQTINGIDKGRIARNKMSAANAIEYQKSIAKLGPLYNPDYEAFVRNGNTLDKFSSENGVWMNTAASPYSTLQELVHPSFKEIKPHALSKEEVESRNYVYNPLYDYEGITRADMEKVMGTLLPGVRDDKRFQYHRELARRDLLAENEGVEPTEKEINQRLINNAIEADAQIMTPFTYDANKFALERQKLSNQIYANRQHEIDKAIYGGGSGGGRGSNAPSVFRESRANLYEFDAPNSNRATMMNARGNSVGYDPFEDPHYQWIDPVGEGIRVDKNGNNGYVYWIPKRALNTLYISDSRFGKDKKAITDTSIPINSDRYFVPVGQMHTERINGNERYFITGTLTTGSSKDDNGNYNYVNNVDGQGLALFDLEVTERAFNYAKKQQSVNAPSN